MRRYESSTINTVIILTILYHKVIQKLSFLEFVFELSPISFPTKLNNDFFYPQMLSVKSEGNQESVSKNPSSQLLPVIPSLPSGTITGNTVDCVNVRHDFHLSILIAISNSVRSTTSYEVDLTAVHCLEPLGQHIFRYFR